MALLVKYFEAGVIHTTIYTFEKVGDVLPRHTHDINTAHITIVARGKMRMVTDTETVDLMAGQTADTPPFVYHEFTALEDDSRIYNIIKYPLGDANASDNNKG